LVDGVLGRRQGAKINDAHAQNLHENKPTEISISCNKDAALLPGCREQIRVVGPRESDLTGSNNVMPQADQEVCRYRVNVLVE
jgi:hypothetical protein